MKVLKTWTAKRAGGRITILHSEGKVPHIDKITTREGRIVATAADGHEFELLLDAPGPRGEVRPQHG